jgi:hypothetical protein
MKRIEWYDPSVTLPRMKRVIPYFLVFEDALLGAPFSTSTLNFNLCLRDNHPYTDKGCMDSREERIRGG